MQKKTLRKRGLLPSPVAGEGGRIAESGNSLAVKHGAYALLRLTPRAEELADELRELVPLASPFDSATIDALALVLAQLERASVFLSHVQGAELEHFRSGERLDKDERDDLRRLASDTRSWANTALRYAEALGLTPSARMKLGIDAAQAQDALAELAARGREIRERRGET
jgi:hypothetical protein